MNAKILIALIAVAGIILFSGCLQPTDGNETPIKVSVCDLSNNPFNIYSNKTIETEGTLKYSEGNNIFVGNGYFYLEDGNCSIRVKDWVPLEVMMCAPTVNCPPEVTMGTYFGKNLNLTGVFKEFPKQEYINKKWTNTGTYYAIDEVKNVSILS